MKSSEGFPDDDLEKALAYRFCNKGLLREAFTHSSYSNENGLNYDYERLEFLGDAVLELIISEYIMNNYKDFDEGTMSGLRAYVVNESFLSEAARSRGIDRYIYLGKGETVSNVRRNDAIAADVLEAVIAAIYLDGGYEAAKSTALLLLKEGVDSAARAGSFSDPKSDAQKLCQKCFNALPVYKVISETGPDHDKFFVVEVDLCGFIKARGSGKSKKQAEKAAALAALKAYEEKQRG